MKLPTKTMSFDRIGLGTMSNGDASGGTKAVDAFTMKSTWESSDSRSLRNSAGFRRR